MLVVVLPHCWPVAEMKILFVTSVPSIVREGVGWRTDAGHYKRPRGFLKREIMKWDFGWASAEFPTLTIWYTGLTSVFFFRYISPTIAKLGKKRYGGDGPVQKMHHFFNVSTIDGGEE
jgi:hypothetical protein